MKRVLFLALCVASYIMHSAVLAQVDTLRGKVPYFHYNYYDSNWCKSQEIQGCLSCVIPLSNCINKIGINGDHAGGGRFIMCSNISVNYPGLFYCSSYKLCRCNFC